MGRRVGVLSVLSSAPAPRHTCHSLPPLDDFCQRLSAHSSGRGGGQLSPSNCSASVPAPGSQRVGIAFAPIRPSVGLPPAPFGQLFGPPSLFVKVFHFHGHLVLCSRR